MYAKVFSQIFDSSISEDYLVRIVFIDLLTLSDRHGHVDITPEALARRTNVPIEVVQRGLEKLGMPDPKSRSKAHEGRRIIALDSHRDWGWKIVNYEQYRDMRDENARRDYQRDLMRKNRACNRLKKQEVKLLAGVSSVSTCEHLLAHIPVSLPVSLETKSKSLVLDTSSEKSSSKKEVQEYCTDIYEQYPRKIARPTAIKAIEKSLTRLLGKEKTNGYTDLHGAYEWLFLKTQEYADERKGQDDKFTPHPATWYNQSRYLDEGKRG